MATSSAIRVVDGGRSVAARVRQVDRVSFALGIVFLLTASLFIWTANAAVPLSLHDPTGDRYNLLATAFLHLRLSVGHAPAALMHLLNPYDPRLNATVPVGPNDVSRINDDAMYHGQLYFIWGPAPALVLLVPLHLLGFEPSTSFTVAVFGIVGVGFALATLRVLLRYLGDGTPIWMCVVAGFALAFASVVPFLERTPSVTVDTLTGGYCFTMAGIWLAMSALARRNASAIRLVLMSLCFGLAANSRPTLVLTSLVLVPVYLSLRSSRSHRQLLTYLVLPVSICLLLMLAYNQARFNNPFEIGATYQITGFEPRTAPLGRLSYVLPGAGFYGLTPPRPLILFPFLLITAPEAYAPGLNGPEPTGGILPMAPIVIFILALPWIWRRRSALLGPLAVPLITLAGVGLFLPLVPSYQYFAPTERYEVDFAGLLVLGGVAGWLALSKGATRYRRRLLQIGGGLLAAWSCATGLAISFFGGGTLLAITHPGTWDTLEDIGSPLSTAIASVLGHPVLGAINAYNVGVHAPLTYMNLGTGVSSFTLNSVEQAGITIVSPNGRRAGLAADVELAPGTSYGVRLKGSGNTSSNYTLPAGGGLIDIPISLSGGINRFTLTPVPLSARDPKTTSPVMGFSSISVASR
jgi:hypothetical protein